MTPIVRPSPAVAAALAESRPVVALESTIITHGMPWPDNLAMARGVESLVRENGAEPATIVVMDGEVRVGLDDGDLEKLAQARDVLKLSRADLAYGVSSGRTGSTTVAATMIGAHLAGIRVFATGGIGGVHRDAETSFDISADLDELARTPVIVVSAGAKAILDLKKTFEVLETKGVPVVGYGCDELPAFWSRDSGIATPIRLDSPEAIARFQATREALGIDGGMLVANPLPQEHEIDSATIGSWIGQALADASSNAISGKAATPYLLKRIFELSQGRSLASNIELVRSNARLASAIAVALASR
ncbi:pseudouridine-5'-phosphate glycosidase [Aureimonas jatrophae]|uniref:Pseudouridine-5'-phosphate glycosidase n=1 Tax=Aureimonas jatrophae TaxID=1166073 RepID=A0A1H0GIV7_9HYPH|nr:pseudouridine-5'-phosphate glycosidase [Aureimonas jatrophae]MBB3949596.1 pseudouridine-5'-phosphate glycosidase [Aureimonas jatrophae]SDO06925.1 pseudouridine-5'-phosphate glycosidase [Aureimonas jatrophae]